MPTPATSRPKLILAAHLRVKEDLSTGQAGVLIAALERELIRPIPSLEHIFLEVEPPDERRRAQPADRGRI